MRGCAGNLCCRQQQILYHQLFNLMTGNTWFDQCNRIEYQYKLCPRQQVQ